MADHEAWEDYTTTDCQAEITNAFKKCGMYNDIYGRENHLIKIDRFKDYKPPAKEDPLELIPKKNEEKGEQVNIQEQRRK